jgi:hypothetical protein
LSTPTPSAAQARPARDRLLRWTLFLGVLGAVLAAVYALFLADLGPSDIIMGLDPTSYRNVVGPLAAVGCAAGILILEWQPLLGMCLAIVGTFIAMPVGGVYLVPGTLLASAWAARNSFAARAVLGYVLLFPGIVAVFYSISSIVSYYAGVNLYWLPEALQQPATWRNALAPALFLPVAWLGAWLLTGLPKPESAGR